MAVARMSETTRLSLLVFIPLPLFKRCPSNRQRLRFVRSGSGVKQLGTALQNGGGLSAADFRQRRQAVAAPLQPVSYTHLDVYKRQTEAQVKAKLPTGVQITLGDGSRQTAGVKWLCETSFDGNQSGDYIFKGTLAAASGIANPNGLQAEIKMCIRDRMRSMGTPTIQ